MGCELVPGPVACMAARGNCGLSPLLLQGAPQIPLKDVKSGDGEWVGAPREPMPDPGFSP